MADRRTRGARVTDGPSGAIDLRESVQRTRREHAGRTYTLEHLSLPLLRRRCVRHCNNTPKAIACPGIAAVHRHAQRTVSERRACRVRKSRTSRVRRRSASSTARAHSCFLDVVMLGGRPWRLRVLPMFSSTEFASFEYVHTSSLCVRSRSPANRLGDHSSAVARRLGGSGMRTIVTERGRGSLCLASPGTDVTAGPCTML